MLFLAGKRGVIRKMNFEDFLKSNYWKTHILGKSFDGVRSELGEPTDEGYGKLKRSLKKFGDIEVGFNEEGLAYYCQIDFSPNHQMKIFNECWPIYGGMGLMELTFPQI